MRIVFIRSNPVSPDSRVEKEVNTLIASGHQVEILAWDRETNYGQRQSRLILKDTACDVTRFGIKASYGGGFKQNIKGLVLFQLAVRKWLITHQKTYDVIHACDFDTAYVAAKVAHKIKKPFVYDIFDYYVDAFTVPKLLRYMIEKADIKTIGQAVHTIICTEARAKQIAAAIPQGLTVIHNTPASYPESGSDYAVNAERLTIAYIGVLQEGRMLKELIDIVCENDRFELHIGGFGILEEHIKRMSEEHDRIHFYGKLPYEKTLQLEKQCDVLTALYDPLVPNHTYAAPNKFYEALMLGKPLVMARQTGLDSVVSSEQFGKVIDFNKEALREALEELEKEKTSFHQIAQKMKACYREKFSWEEMEKRLLSLYKSMEEDNEKNHGSFWHTSRSDKDVPFSKRTSI